MRGLTVVSEESETRSTTTNNSKKNGDFQRQVFQTDMPGYFSARAQQMTDIY